MRSKKKGSKAHVIVMAEIQSPQDLKNVSPRKFEAETASDRLELVENRVIQILEH